MVAEDRTHMAAIEKFIGQKIPRVKQEGFNYKYTALFEDEKSDASPYDRKVRGVRVHGGYVFGSARRKRR